MEPSRTYSNGWQNNWTITEWDLPTGIILRRTTDNMGTGLFHYHVVVDKDQMFPVVTELFKALLGVAEAIAPKAGAV